MTARAAGRILRRMRKVRGYARPEPAGRSAGGRTNERSILSPGSPRRLGPLAGAIVICLATGPTCDRNSDTRKPSAHGAPRQLQESEPGQLETTDLWQAFLDAEHGATSACKDGVFFGVLARNRMVVPYDQLKVRAWALRPLVDNGLLAAQEHQLMMELLPDVRSRTFEMFYDKLRRIVPLVEEVATAGCRAEWTRARAVEVLRNQVAVLEMPLRGSDEAGIRELRGRAKKLLILLQEAEASVSAVRMRAKDESPLSDDQVAHANGLVRLLTHRRPMTRWKAVRALGSRKPGAGQAIGALVRALSDKQWFIRERASWAIEQADEEARRCVVADLLALAQDDAPDIRYYAIRNLGKLRIANEQVVDAVADALRDKWAGIRRLAAMLLADFDDHVRPHLIDLETAFEVERSKGVRVEMEEAIRAIEIR